MEITTTKQYKTRTILKQKIHMGCSTFSALLNWTANTLERLPVVVMWRFTSRQSLRTNASDKDAENFFGYSKKVCQHVLRDQFLINHFSASKKSKFNSNASCIWLYRLIYSDYVSREIQITSTWLFEQNLFNLGYTIIIKLYGLILFTEAIEFRKNMTSASNMQ